MSVLIDEMTAEVAPPPGDAAAPPAGASQTTPPEIDPRKLRDQFERLEHRMARTHAD